MRAESAHRLSRSLLVVALALVLLSLVWALRTTPPPNADRYDYAGRAFQATQGHGVVPLVVYPLRMIFPGAEDWPPENLTRAPLWPTLLVPGLKLGMDDQSGVWLSAAFALLLVLGMRWIGDRSFGGAAGSMAGLAMAASFSTWIVLRGGGPEIAMALLVLLLWTWIPRGGGRLAHLACGTLYGLLPMLHPTGWIFGGAALLARSNRYERSQLVWILLGAILVAAPWHLNIWMMTGNPLGTLQSYAELARNLDDPGGIGPYRGLQAMPTAQVLSERWTELARLALHRLKVQLLFLDAWLAWPLAALAIYGAIHETRLALRDMLLGLGVFAALAAWSAEFRTLLPMLPVACLWVGVGFARLLDRVRPSLAIALGLSAVVGSWVLPLGASEAPIHEKPRWRQSALSPPASLVNRLREAGPAGAPIFTDSAALAWRARREALLLPIDPPTLEILRGYPALASTQVIALGLGRESRWCDSDAWQEYLDRCEILYQHPEGPVLLLLPADAEAADSLSVSEVEAAAELDSMRSQEPLVDRDHPLLPDFVPSDLVELDTPPATRSGLQLRASAAEALRQLVEAAHADSVELRVVSAFRSFERQLELYRSAEARHGEGQNWVAKPGSSEHQLGTTVDFADAALQHVLEPSFAETVEGRWLAEHAPRFGFTLSYPEGSLELTGYQAEPWHYRHRETGTPRQSSLPSDIEERVEEESP